MVGLLQKWLHSIHQYSSGDKKKPRILFILQTYPQLSQTYIKSEISALLDNFDIEIIATSVPNFPDSDHQPFHHIEEIKKILKVARKFKPSVIHGHYLVNAEVVAEVANRLGKPFTIRAHSFDAIKSNENDPVPKHILNLKKVINSDACLGVLAFPFSRKLLEGDGGILPEKIIDAPPVVDFHKFYNRQKNQNDVMNTGACLPKKQMQDFIHLASDVPTRKFNLYAIGYDTQVIVALNEEKGHVANIINSVPFSEMPSVYKQHGWIVYTASSKLRTVGWPMAIAEAQASGVVACMANIRPDIHDYLGDSAHIYNDIKEMIEVLKAPPDQLKREMGFENARQYDINDKIHLLTDLWEPHLN